MQCSSSLGGQVTRRRMRWDRATASGDPSGTEGPLPVGMALGDRQCAGVRDNAAVWAVHGPMAPAAESPVSIAAGHAGRPRSAIPLTMIPSRSRKVARGQDCLAACWAAATPLFRRLFGADARELPRRCPRELLRRYPEDRSEQTRSKRWLDLRTDRGGTSPAANTSVSISLGQSGDRPSCWSVGSWCIGCNLA